MYPKSHYCVSSLILVFKILHRFVQFSTILDQQFCLSRRFLHTYTEMENVMASAACVSRKLEMKSTL